MSWKPQNVGRNSINEKGVNALFKKPLGYVVIKEKDTLTVHSDFFDKNVITFTNPDLSGNYTKAILYPAYNSGVKEKLKRLQEVYSGMKFTTNNEQPSLTDCAILDAKTKVHS